MNDAQTERVCQSLDGLDIELPSWGFADTGTRFGKFHQDAAEKQKANQLVELLTPIAKAFISDKGFECCVMGQQVFGGHGFIREWGQEQLVRDARIAQIYEGTNGIQALDLVKRKIIGSGGELLGVFMDEINSLVDESPEGFDEFRS